MIWILLLLILSGCTHYMDRQHKYVHAHHKRVKPLKNYSYTIRNSHGTFKVFVQNHFFYDKKGIASYYSKQFAGRKTATGERFNPNHYTAAHPYLPLPCVAEISLIDCPQIKIIVKINDRGPYTKHGRIIDLSHQVARELGFERQGTARVRVKVLVKETLMLKEHGGHIDWKGDVPFHQALKRC